MQGEKNRYSVIIESFVGRKANAVASTNKANAVASTNNDLYSTESEGQLHNFKHRLKALTLVNEHGQPPWL